MGAPAYLRQGRLSEPVRRALSSESPFPGSPRLEVGSLRHRWTLGSFLKICLKDRMEASLGGEMPGQEDVS